MKCLVTTTVLKKYFSDESAEVSRPASSETRTLSHVGLPKWSLTYNKHFITTGGKNNNITKRECFFDSVIFCVYFKCAHNYRQITKRK